MGKTYKDMRDRELANDRREHGRRIEARRLANRPWQDHEHEMTARGRVLAAESEAINSK
jgi:hypothetical protein